jgi:hypothetical protein
MASCLCIDRGYVRALEEDDFGFPDKVVTIAELKDALLGRCRHCGAWWERLPHYVYGYAWYRTDQARWHPWTRPWRFARRRRADGNRSADGLTCAAST